MADFPSALPYPHASSYTVQPDNAFIRTDFDAGPARQRRRFTATPKTIELEWLLNTEQMAIFVNFFENDIALGAAWFNCTLDIGLGFLPYTTRFIQSYQASKISYHLWRVSSKVEVENA